MLKHKNGNNSMSKQQLSRRGFMKLAGAAGAAAGIPHWTPQLLAQTGSAASSLAPVFPPLYIDGNVTLSKILAYDPTQDPNAKYFRSLVPIAPRIASFAATQAKPTLSPKPQVANFSNFYNSLDNGTGYGTTRYGATNDVFISRFLQYQDVTSFWQVFTTIPNPALTDAAHRNGSPCIGFMFNNPPGSGFDPGEFLQQDQNGEFPVANKLADLAVYFGFDGYMFDMESDFIPDQPTFELAMQFLQGMRQRAKSKGLSALYLQVYASTLGFGDPSDTSNDWETLNGRTVQWFGPGGASSLFLDYQWPYYFSDTEQTVAQYQGKAPYYIDPFQDVFCGLELEGRSQILISPSGEGGYTQNYVPQAIPADGGGAPLASLALFDPVNQTVSLATQAATAANHNIQPPLATLQTAIYAAERQFWSGQYSNPAIPSTIAANDGNSNDTYGGIADYITERSVIGSFPFVSRFNTGSGNQFFVDGQVSSESPWFNMGAQEVLPTWQWWTKAFASSSTTGGLLSADYDATTGWNGGSSLKISGDLGPENATELRLFKTKLDIPVDHNRHWISVTYKSGQSGPTNLYVGLIFEDDPAQTVWVGVDDCEPAYQWGWGGTWGYRGWYELSRSWGLGWPIASGPRNGSGWSQAVVNLQLYQGRTIAAISLGFKAGPKVKTAANYAINVGEIALSNDVSQSHESGTPTGFAINNSQISTDGTSAQLLLTWNFDPTIWYYDISRRKEGPDGEDMTWLGRVSCDCYYLSDLPRGGAEKSTVIQLVAVAPDGTEKVSDDATAKFSWT